MWFLERIAEIVAAEEEVCRNGLPRDAEGLRRLKAMGFSDKRLAYLAPQSAHLQPGTRTATARGSGLKIGRASCRERGCEYVSVSVVAVSLKKKEKSSEL